MNRKSKTADPPTIAEIATALKLTPRRISQLKLEGLPTHSIEAAQAWRAEQGDADDSATALRKARISLLKAQGEKARLELSLRKGELLDRREAESDWTSIALAIRAAMLALENSLAPALHGLNPNQMREVLHRELYRILNTLADYQSEFWRKRPSDD